MCWQTKQEPLSLLAAQTVTQPRDEKIKDDSPCFELISSLHNPSRRISDASQAVRDTHCIELSDADSTKPNLKRLRESGDTVQKNDDYQENPRLDLSIKEQINLFQLYRSKRESARQGKSKSTSRYEKINFKLSETRGCQDAFRNISIACVGRKEYLHNMREGPAAT